METRMVSSRSTLFGFAVALVMASQVNAQESQQSWRITSPAGRTDIYNTQQDAVAAFATLPEPMPDVYTGGWPLAKQIKDQVISENGDMTLTYWLGKEPPKDPDWRYVAAPPDREFVTEQQLINDLVAQRNAQYPACPAIAQLAPANQWTAFSEELEGIYEGRTYNGSYNVGDNTADWPCRPVNITHHVVRKRRLLCPNYMSWSNEHQACTNEKYVATISTKINECPQVAQGSVGARGSNISGNVGNPCNVKNGEKSESQVDVDLGWITLERHYHSGAGVKTGGFGPGWSHTFDIRLAIAGNSLGLSSGSGYQTPFRKNGSDYWAADGSGERVTASGSNWLLQRSDRTLTFDASGRLLRQNVDSGAQLSFAYDALGRLVRITHSTGRAMAIIYDGPSADARIASLWSTSMLASYAYTPRGQVEVVTYPGNQAIRYHYEDTRFPLHLTGITGEDGARFSTFAYDAKGRAISSQHAGGADAVNISYRAQGGAVVTDALGQQTTYGLTAFVADGPPRRIGDVTDQRGVVTQTYRSASEDFRRRLDAIVDRRGIRTQYAYTEGNDPVTGQPARTQSVTEAYGSTQARVTTSRYDISSNRLVLQTIGARETRIARNQRLQPVSITVRDTISNLVRTTAYAYCEAADVSASNGSCPTLGLLKTVDGPRTDVGDITTFEYYGSDDPACTASSPVCTYRKGDLRRTVNALGHTVTVMGYDPQGRPLSVTDANGVITDYEYNPRGWLTASKERGVDNGSETDDRITRIDYWPTGLVKKLTLPDGTFTGYTYNAARQLTDVGDNAGDTIHYTLDLTGNRKQEDTKTSGGTLKRTLSRVFNALGQLQVAKNAYQDQTQFTYDANGNPDIVTDALGRASDADHDPLNRLSRELRYVDNQPVEMKREYNALDQVTKVTDPKGLITAYSYNGFGDQTQLASPDTGTTAFTYDTAGNRKTRTDARGVVATYGYDALNRLTGISYPTTTQNVGYTYDTVPTACPAAEAFGKGRVSQLTDEAGATQYCYDRFGQLVRKVQTVNAKVFTVRYAYTPAGKLSSLTYPDGALVTYQRNAQGRVNQVSIKRVVAGATIETLLNQASYNPFGAVAGWTFGNGRTFSRSANLDYQITALQDAASGGLSVGLQYDKVGNISELRAAGGATALLKYGYDALNRLTTLRDGPTNTAIESYSYDATGNRLSYATSAGTQTYTYPTTNHRLSQISAGSARSYDATGNSTAIGGNTFVYNDAGRMSQFKQAGVLRQTYLYNGVGQQVRKYTDTYNRYMVYDEAGHWLGEYDSNGGAIHQAIWLDDLPVGLFYSGSNQQKLYYLEPDHIGTPRVVIDPVRNVAVWAWDMKGEAFGNSPPNQDPDMDGAGFVFSMRFPGQRFDVLSGLSYNYFRDYEAGTGRYAQSDPIGLKGGIHTYAYGGGNPVSRVDPFGLTECDVDAAYQTAKEALPNLNFGAGRPKMDLPNINSGGTALGEAHFVQDGRDGFIHLSKYFLPELGPVESLSLLKSVIHEALHFTRPIKDQRPWNNFDHAFIAPEAVRLAKELNDRYQAARKSQCDCGE